MTSALKAVVGYPILSVGLFFALVAVLVVAAGHYLLGDDRMRELGLSDWDNPEPDFFTGT